MMPDVAVLAGGLATRLRPITEQVPKAMIDVNGQPFISHQLALLRTAGVRRVVLCVGHLAQALRAHVGDGSHFGLQVVYSTEDGPLLGTGGAIRQALPLLSDPFFVLYGDSYLPCDYQAVAQAFAASPRAALMTVYRNEGRFDASNVEFSSGAIRCYEKRATPLPGMHHIDYGLGAFRHRAFATVPPGQVVDLAHLYGDLLARNELAAYEVFERFYDGGSTRGLDELRHYLKSLEEAP
jgi:MurNAc alpha-1-phosphate uridylyltransferase